MSNYTPPEYIEFKYLTEYIPPVDNVVFLFTDGVIDSFDIISESFNLAYIIENGNTTEGYRVKADILTLNNFLSFTDVDGNITDGHKITEIPVILSDNIDLLTQLTDSSISGGQNHNLPIKNTLDFKASWKKCLIVSEQKMGSSWEESKKLNPSVNVKFLKAEKLKLQINSGWDSHLKTDIDDKIEWQRLKDFSDKKINSSFVVTIPYKDDKRKVIWSKFEQQNSTHFNFKYLYPPSKDKKNKITWEKFNVSDDSLLLAYKQPFPNDKQHKTYWGAKWYSLLCGSHYYPPFSTDEIPLFRPKFSELEEGLKKDKFIFTVNNLRCPYNYPYSGARQPYDVPIIKPDIPEQTITPIKGFYYIMNSTFIRRISSNMESIDFQSVSISIDRDSWLWSFNIVILSQSSFNLIKPQNNIFHSVEININGWKWTCKIENWRETITFGKRSWSVTGRSEAIELGEPYSFIPAYSNEQMQGGQIVDDILENTNWAAEWKNFTFNPFVNWLVPAGCLNIANTSIIKIIQSVTDSINAFVQTNADTNTSIGATGVKKLYIKPTYKANAWNWGNITPSVALNDSVCREIGRSNINYSVVNNVIVSGENQGVAVNATRQGSAGDKPASSITDPLLTTREAGVERARHIISKSGTWVNHTLSLFSLLPPNSSLPLLLAGDFIQMNESGNLWMGQVTGNNISSAWSNNGLKTTQTIEVEQYIGD